ncbi:helix-turn-helix domain-containing protein [Curtobacterium sp. VKM Ac-1395]|uniref:helix-turn-helix domain-containing protein n=1 Tax=Curtobacterium sp. VKM Ac-1395 TaxID=2783815 RepID=UPI002B278017|nr:helix-turn-helix domain-containing protein [Curtobacterium sp. VKM Ac-1395]
MHRAGTHSIQELAEPFAIGRATVYRCIERQSHHNHQPNRHPLPDLVRERIAHRHGMSHARR